MSHLKDVCLHLVEIAHLTTQRGALYHVQSWDELDGFYITNDETRKTIIRSEKIIFKYMRPASVGYEMFKKELPEYFL